MNFDGYLDETDPRKCPPIYRYSDALHTKCRELCSKFKRLFECWGGTGKGNPLRIAQFCKNKHGKINAGSRRIVIVFYVCKCHKQSVDREFAEILSKGINNSRRRGLELGFEGSGDHGSDVPETLSSPPSSYTKRRKKNGSDLDSVREAGIKGILGALNKIANPVGSEVDPEMVRLEKRQQLMKIVQQATEMENFAKQNGNSTLELQARKSIEEGLKRLLEL